VVLINLVTGRLLIFPRRETDRIPAPSADAAPRRALGEVLREGLPLMVAIAGAPVLSLAMDVMGLDFPSETAFIGSLTAGVFTTFLQSGTSLQRLPALLLQKSIGRMLLLIAAIFFFKDMLIAADAVRSLSAFAQSKAALFCLFLVLPFISGVLTGLLAGIVGASFPLLLSLMEQQGLGDDRLIWLSLALVAGNLGQMVSPLHSCFIMTADFFRVSIFSLWRKVLAPSLLTFLLSMTYVALLCAVGARA
jgi:hypothetical protein